MANRWRTSGNSSWLYFLVSKITADGDCSHEIKRCLLLEKKAMTKLDSIFKSRDITLPTKVCLVKAMVFPVVMYGCESWTIKKAVHRKRDQFWVFIGRTDVEAEIPILWPPNSKSWLIWKDPDAGKVWRHEEKGMTEDEMIGCYHRLHGHGFEWTPRVGDGQGGLACCDSWGCKESDTTERLNWTVLWWCMGWQ